METTDIEQENEEAWQVELSVEIGVIRNAVELQYQEAVNMILRWSKTPDGLAGPGLRVRSVPPLPLITNRLLKVAKTRTRKTSAKPDRHRYEH